MDRAEPAFKPEWLKSSSNGNSNHFASNNHHVGTSPHSDEQHGVGISSRNRLSSSSSSKSLSSRRTLTPTSSKIQDSKIQESKSQDSNSNKSRAYSSFGSCRRERDRVRDYELQKEKRVPDSGFEFDNPLRRSRSMVTNNGVRINARSKMGSFEKEFPSLGGENGLNGLPGRVSSPGSINSVLMPLSGVESWNSVLVDVPHSDNTSGNGNGVNGAGGNGGNGAGLGMSGPVSPVTLNMAETVAQAPSRVRTPPQLTIDTQKIEERTLKQFKQLIPVTPSMPKSSVSSSLDKLKPKTPTNSLISTPKPSSIHPVSSQPLSPAVHSSKPSQIGNFQVLNRDKNGISLSNPSPPPVIAKPAAGPALSSPTLPSKSPTKRTQSKDKLEFFKFIRNQSLGAASSPPLDQDKDKEEEEDKITEEVEKRLVIADPGLNGEMELDPDPDPEEEAFLLSLGWDQNAEVDELTKEEIEAFIVKYKEVKQSS